MSVIGETKVFQTCFYIDPHPLPGSQVVHVQFPCFAWTPPRSIGGRSTARERSQTCSSVLKPPGMEGSVLRLQPSPAPSRKVGTPHGEYDSTNPLRVYNPCSVFRFVLNIHLCAGPHRLCMQAVCKCVYFCPCVCVSSGSGAPHAAGGRSIGVRGHGRGLPCGPVGLHM